MKLPRRSDVPLAIFACLSILSLISVGVNFAYKSAHAEEDLIAKEEGYFDTAAESHYITIYDDGDPLTIRSDARTVEEVLSRAGVTVDDADGLEPSKETEINSDNFKINIYRAYPVLLIDGTSKTYFMTSKHDEKSIFEQAGITVYDGDEISRVESSDFLDSGVAEALKITRGSGERVTVTEEIPFEEVVEQDYTLAKGTSKITQYGETGEKESVYELRTVDGVETERILVSETVTKPAVPRITSEGALTVATVAPGREECASWARAAGVSEADLTAALDLIYHESGCRVNASNGSSGAYGIPQALPGAKMATAGSDWATNPVTQIRWMASYVQKYGGWGPALAFWYAHGWY